MTQNFTQYVFRVVLTPVTVLGSGDTTVSRMWTCQPRTKSPYTLEETFPSEEMAVFPFILGLILNPTI